MKRKKKKKFLSNTERTGYKICIFTIVILIIAIVCSQTSLAQVNLEIQKLNDKVTDYKDTNASLSMKIDEMTSLDKIEKVSKDYGLEYHSENIKTIE